MIAGQSFTPILSGVDPFRVEPSVRRALDVPNGADGPGYRSPGIQVEVAGDLPAVYGDRARLFELVRRLLDNAVRYMGEPADLVASANLGTGAESNAVRGAFNRRRRHLVA